MPVNCTFQQAWLRDPKVMDWILPDSYPGNAYCKRFRHLTRAEEVLITRLRIGHTKATKSHILSRGPPTACQHCGQTDNWARTPGMYSVATKSWWVLYRWLIEDPLWDDPGGLHNRISEKLDFIISYEWPDIQHTSLSNQSPADDILKLN